MVSTQKSYLTTILTREIISKKFLKNLNFSLTKIFGRIYFPLNTLHIQSYVRICNTIYSFAINGMNIEYTIEYKMKRCSPYVIANFCYLVSS